MRGLRADQQRPGLRIGDACHSRVTAKDRCGPWCRLRLIQTCGWCAVGANVEAAAPMGPFDRYR